MQVEIADPCVDDFPDGWDEFVRSERLPVSALSGPMRAASFGARAQTRVAVVRDAGEIVAGFCGDLPDAADRKRFRSPGTSVPRVAMFRCRLPISFTRGVFFDTAADSLAREAAVRAFERAMRRRHRFRLAGFVYERVDPWGTFRHGLRRETAPTYRLALRWSCLADYLAALPAGRRRKFARLHADLERDPAIEACTGSWVDARSASRLDAETRSKHGGGRPTAPLLPSYFDAIDEAPGTSYLGYRSTAGEEALAFDLVVPYADTLMTVIHGSRDPRVGGIRNAYFDLYLQDVAFALENGYRAIDFGPGMGDVKRRFGADETKQWAVIRP